MVRGDLYAGNTVAVTAWRQDANGTIWYEVWGKWASADNLSLLQPAPDATNPRPLWRRVAGKGMWMTLGVAQDSPRTLMRSAARLGLTHVYVEAAISPLGFHGRRAVGPLLDAAHRYHIAVIAWVFPYLHDLASDVALTRTVADFRTAAGNRFAGVAADLETNIQATDVRTYSQLIRATLGPHSLLVGVTYPPGDFPGYPFATVARSYNVIAPMDYWHQTETSYGLRFGHMRYGYDYARRYAEETVTALRHLGSTVRVAPIGQAFDDFGRLEMGPHAPSAAEVHGFLDGSKASGAIGVSFFDWTSATYPEWREIRNYDF